MKITSVTVLHTDVEMVRALEDAYGDVSLGVVGEDVYVSWYAPPEPEDTAAGYAGHWASESAGNIHDALTAAFNRIPAAPEQETA